MVGAADNERMSVKRQPKGIPTGGEFAANEHDEAESSLDQHIRENDILAISAEHMDAVEKVVGEKDSLVTTAQAEELLSAESGSRPRMYGLAVKDDGGYEIVKIGSAETLHSHDLAAQWTSGTTVSDLISPARTVDSPEYKQARWETDRETFEALSEPADADFQDTLDTITADISNDSFPNGEHSWNNVVGRNARRTAANKSRYAEHAARVAGNDPTYREKHKKYAKVNAELKSFGRAYDRGIAIDPRAEAYFESNWNDPESNHGEVGTRRELERIQEMAAGLRAGTVKPSSVVGTGYRNPKAAAEEYLERREREQKRAIHTRGRSHSVIASNALYRARRDWQD